ncbi:MAG: HesA/MoeB/ThiF family protein [gamma proteobacterium symbiont of Bathyaustriella thionipta]|nr:HesA/MoeB/ThiF family protein [gamma proteobacterium symbiont of Bathyaustriella thionipta]
MQDAQLSRYSRQIMLPELDIQGQQQLNNSHVAIIGMGGLGSPAAMYLAAAGIGQLTLCDFDRVDLSNLQRQILHNSHDIGKHKTVSAQQHLQALNPECRIVQIQQKMHLSKMSELAANADVLLDCTDNFASRFALNQACVEQATPLVSAAAIRWEGQISVFSNEPDSACYQCLYPAEGEENQNCVNNGVIAPLVGIMGSMQALECIKLITATGSTLKGRLLTLNALDMSWREFKFLKDPDCKACSHAHS